MRLRKSDSVRDLADRNENGETARASVESRKEVDGTVRGEQTMVLEVDLVDGPSTGAKESG